jgi:hypothetical protein
MIRSTQNPATSLKRIIYSLSGYLCTLPGGTYSPKSHKKERQKPSEEILNITGTVKGFNKNDLEL